MRRSGSYIRLSTLGQFTELTGLSVMALIRQLTLSSGRSLSGRIDFMDDGLVPYVVPSESRFGEFATRFQRREMTEREFGAYYSETLRQANGVCRRTLWTPAFCDR